MRFDSGAFERGAVKVSSIIITEFADVPGSESPGLASDHGAGDLAPGKNAGGFEFDFGAASGILVEGDERVGGIEADADHIYLRRRVHWKRVIRQRRRPQATRRIRETTERKSAGVQFAGRFGMLALFAK